MVGPADNVGMQGFGQRLRARAKELGLSDTAVAERLDMSQQRYANYVRDVSEPDFETLVRICRALAVTSDQILGLDDGPESASEVAVLQARIQAGLGVMSVETLRTAAVVVGALADQDRARKPGRRS